MTTEHTTGQTPHSPTPHSPTPWKACSANDGKCPCGLIWDATGFFRVATATGPNSEDETSLPLEVMLANRDFIVTACNAHSALVAENAALKESHADRVGKQACQLEQLSRDLAYATAREKGLVEALGLVRLCIEAHESESTPKWIRGMKSEVEHILARHAAPSSATKREEKT